jgi:CheY-like chemotaxis protein
MNTITGANEPAAAGRRVLLVDDSIETAQAMSMLLEALGHVVRTTHDGSQALAVVADFRPDIVILDIGLPGMSGFELAQALRARSETKEALLIALTGYGSDEDQQRSRDAGFDHHLVKPVQFDALEALIAQSFSGQGSRAF